MWTRLRGVTEPLLRGGLRSGLQSPRWWMGIRLTTANPDPPHTAHTALWSKEVPDDSALHPIQR